MLLNQRKAYIYYKYLAFMVHNLVHNLYLWKYFTVCISDLRSNKIQTIIILSGGTISSSIGSKKYIVKNFNEVSNQMSNNAGNGLGCVRVPCTPLHTYSVWSILVPYSQAIVSSPHQSRGRLDNEIKLFT